MTGKGILRAAAVSLIAAAAGYLAAAMGLPLAWVLAPMMVTALAAFVGIEVANMQTGRKLGQLVVGSAIGLTMTPEAAELLLVWAPYMVLTAVISVLVTALFAVPFARALRVELPTGFFALTPGGLSEMARVGETEGARPEIVTLVQALRVALVVTLVPLLMQALAPKGDWPSSDSMQVLSLPDFAIVLAAAALAMFSVRLLRASNPWMIGGLMGAGLLAGLGLITGRVPTLAFVAGQYMIGVTIGARFQRKNLLGAGRVLALSPLFIVVICAIMALYGILLHKASGLFISSAVLAASPGGMAEMALTAKIMQLSVVTVTAFHFIRSFIVNAYSLQIYRLFNKIGFFRRGEILYDAVFGGARKN